MKTPHVTDGSSSCAQLALLTMITWFLTWVCGLWRRTMFIDTQFQRLYVRAQWTVVKLQHSSLICNCVWANVNLHTPPCHHRPRMTHFPWSWLVSCSYFLLRLKETRFCNVVFYFQQGTFYYMWMYWLVFIKWTQAACQSKLSITCILCSPESSACWKSVVLKRSGGLSSYAESSGYQSARM